MQRAVRAEVIGECGALDRRFNDGQDRYLSSVAVMKAKQGLS